MSLPPITLSITILCIFLHFHSFYHMKELPSLVCLHHSYVINDREVQRIFFHAFFHVNGEHLLWNMASFWSKGKYMEWRLGSHYLAAMLFFFIILCGCIYIAIQIHLPHIFGEGCAIGLSGVLFALRAIEIEMKNEGFNGYFWTWLELLLISFLIPNASFLGHLSGLLAGYISSTFFVPIRDERYIVASRNWGYSMLMKALKRIFKLTVILYLFLFFIPSIMENYRRPKDFFSLYQNIEDFWYDEILTGDLVYDTVKTIRKFSRHYGLMGVFDYVTKSIGHLKRIPLVKILVDIVETYTGFIITDEWSLVVLGFISIILSSVLLRLFWSFYFYSFSSPSNRDMETANTMLAAEAAEQRAQRNQIIPNNRKRIRIYEDLLIM